MEICGYCGGNCPNEPENSKHLCDGFAGDIDELYAEFTYPLTTKGLRGGGAARASLTCLFIST